MDRLRIFTFFFLVIGFAYADNTPTLSSPKNTVGLWDRFEISITNDKQYPNPYTDVTLNATFTAPDGQTIQSWGFYDGDRTWKLRFMSDRIGHWEYKAAFSDNLKHTEGNFDVRQIRYLRYDIPRRTQSNLVLDSKVESAF